MFMVETYKQQMFTCLCLEPNICGFRLLLALKNVLLSSILSIDLNSSNNLIFLTFFLFTTIRESIKNENNNSKVVKTLSTQGRWNSLFYAFDNVYAIYKVNDWWNKYNYLILGFNIFVSRIIRYHSKSIQSFSINLNQLYFNKLIRMLFLFNHKQLPSNTIYRTSLK